VQNVVFPGARTAQRQAVNAAMSSDFTVQPIAAALPANNAVGEARTASIQPPPRTGTALPASVPMPIPNPTLRFDPLLGLVVIEFYSTAGAVTTSVPSQRQLEEYQKWNVSHLGQSPDGLPEKASTILPGPEHHVKTVTPKQK
jgi:hypothetical protein